VFAAFNLNAPLFPMDERVGALFSVDLQVEFLHEFAL